MPRDEEGAAAVTLSQGRGLLYWGGGGTLGHRCPFPFQALPGGLGELLSGRSTSNGKQMQSPVLASAHVPGVPSVLGLYP